MLAVGRACHALRASFPFALLGFTMLETARGLLAALSLRSRANVREVATLALSADTIIITYDGQVRVPVLCSIDALAALEVGLEMLPPSRVACLAPEILGRGAVDSRAEVFALGVTLYELLTHALPFQGRTAAEMARRWRWVAAWKAAPVTVRPMPRELRSSRRCPSHCSSSLSCWLTAPGVTKSSSAAWRTLRCRAVASKARSAFSGGSFMAGQSLRAQAHGDGNGHGRDRSSLLRCALNSLENLNDTLNRNRLFRPCRANTLMVLNARRTG